MPDFPEHAIRAGQNAARSGGYSDAEIKGEGLYNRDVIRHAQNAARSNREIRSPELRLYHIHAGGRVYKVYARNFEEAKRQFYGRG